MKLICFECGKMVSTEVPEETIVRAMLTCPECIEKAPEGELVELVGELLRPGVGALSTLCWRGVVDGKMVARLRTLVERCR